MGKNSLITDYCQVALRCLKLYTKKKSIGNPTSFAASTMQWCEFAGVTIAQSLIADPTASFAERASAMAQWLSFYLVNPRSTFSIDNEVLKRLLREETVSEFEQTLMLKVVRAVALSEQLWHVNREEVELALRKIQEHLKLDATLPVDRHSMIKDAETCLLTLYRN